MNRYILSIVLIVSIQVSIQAEQCDRFASLYTNIDRDLAHWAKDGISSDLMFKSMHKHDLNSVRVQACRGEGA